MDGEHNGVDFVEISKIFTMQHTFFVYRVYPYSRENINQMCAGRGEEVGWLRPHKGVTAAETLNSEMSHSGQMCYQRVTSGILRRVCYKPRSMPRQGKINLLDTDNLCYNLLYLL